MIFVYILRSYNGIHYTGITKDIVRRFHEHNTGRSKSTKKLKPLSIVYLNICYDYKNAHALELYIKNRSAKIFLNEFILNPAKSYGSINTMKDVLDDSDIRLHKDSTNSNNRNNERQHKEVNSSNSHSNNNDNPDNTNE